MFFSYALAKLTGHEMTCQQFCHVQLMAQSCDKIADMVSRDPCSTCNGDDSRVNVLYGPSKPT